MGTFWRQNGLEGAPVLAFAYAFGSNAHTEHALRAGKHLLLSFPLWHSTLATTH
jgi:hypothetical protein